MTATEWIGERLAGAPPELIGAMVRAVDGEGPVPDQLARAAVRLYTSIRAGAGHRADALPLLAADALFTHAFQAKAELDPDGLDDFATYWSRSGALEDLVR